VSVADCLVRKTPTLAVVPAAGLGTRLRPLSSAIPKEMLPVGGKVALERIVDELIAAGIERAIFVLSANKEPLIKNYFGTQFTTPSGTIAIDYALQTEMLGLGDAILCASAFIPEGEPFVVALGDAVFEEPSVGGLLRRVIQAAVGNTMAVAVQNVPEEKLSRYGIVAPQEATNSTQFAIQTIVEKPEIKDAPSRFAVAARYVVPFDILALLRTTPPSPQNGEIQLTDALRVLLSHNNGQAVPLVEGEARHDLGNKESYYKAFLTFCLQDADTKEALQTFCQDTLRSQDTLLSSSSLSSLSSLSSKEQTA
jgi:UTP--glucose-1-phosphate uridylyltransferase